MGKHVAALALAILCLASCDQLEDIFLIKHEVVFSESTKLAGTVETKTNYSGEDAGKNRLSNTSDWERIDWERTDRIRILCQQAQQDNSDVQRVTRKIPWACNQLTCAVTLFSLSLQSD